MLDSAKGLVEGTNARIYCEYLNRQLVLPVMNQEYNSRFITF